MLTRLRRTWSAHRPTRLLSLVVAPLLLAQCAPSCVPSAGVPGSPQYGDGTARRQPADPRPACTSPRAPNCYWERLSGLGGTLGEVIENDYSSGQHVVQVLATDAAFRTVNCGVWVLFGPPSSARVIGDGDWDMARQMGVNLWVARPTGTCYWERASGYTHRDEVIANSFSNGRQIDRADAGHRRPLQQQRLRRVDAVQPAGATGPDLRWRLGRRPSDGRRALAGQPGRRVLLGAGQRLHARGRLRSSHSGSVPSGPVVVDVGPGDVRFTSVGCGAWTRIG